MSKLRILVVDDDVSIVRLLAHGLSDRFEVLTATSGEEALELARRESPAVILTAQHMPGLTGLELLERIRDEQPATCGILVSGDCDPRTLAAALNLGNIRGYLAKPWSLEDVRRKLDAVARDFEEKQRQRETQRETDAARIRLQAQLEELKHVLQVMSACKVDALLARAHSLFESIEPLLDPAAESAAVDRPNDGGQLGDGWALIGAKGEMIYRNSVFAQLLDPSLSAARANVFEGSHLAAYAPLAQCTQSALQGEHAYAEFTFSAPGSAPRCLEVAAMPVTAPDTQLNALLIVRDQTERAQLLAHLRGLNQIAQATSQSVDFEQRLHLALAACREATGVDGAVVYFLQPDGRTCEFGAAEGVAAETPTFLIQHPLARDTGPLNELLSKGQAVALYNPDLAPAILVDILRRESIVSSAIAPMRGPNGDSGLLCVFSRGPRKFTEADLQLLSSIGYQLGLALHDARLVQQLTEQARTDSLTGLLNRRRFMDLAEREFQRARCRQMRIAVLVGDINRFKRINDTYGHAVGDQALQAVAGLLKRNLRANDLVGRLGGEEFIMLLMDCGERETWQVIHRLEKVFAAVHLTVNGMEIELSMSLGVAFSDPADETLEALIVRADAEMYRVKAEFYRGLAPQLTV